MYVSLKADNYVYTSTPLLEVIMSSVGRGKTQSSHVHVSVNRPDDVDEHKDEVSIRISNRPPTNMGAQGDHASAYHLIQNVAHAIVAGGSLSEAVIKVFALLDRLQAKIIIEMVIVNSKINSRKPSDISTLHEDILYATELYKRNKEFKIIINDTKEKIAQLTANSEEDKLQAQMLKDLFALGSKDDYFKKNYINEKNTAEQLQNKLLAQLASTAEISKNQQLEKYIIDSIKSYLTIRNKLPYTAFPREGNVSPPSGEGARISTAARQLRALEESLLDERGDSRVSIPANSTIEVVLQGQLPNHLLTTFSEEEVAPNGDCGFITLGASRQQVVNCLIELSSDLTVRRALNEEIQQAFATHELKTPEYQILANARNTQQEAYDDLFRNIRVQFPAWKPEPEQTQAEQESNLIHFLRTHSQSNLAEEIVNQRLRIIQSEQTINQYCQTEEVYTLYVNALGGRLWLGYQSALLYAKNNGISLYIWRKGYDNSDPLVLIDHHHAVGSGQVIHMLHTAGFTHFNLLVEKNISLEFSQDDSSSTQFKKTSPSKKIETADIDYSNTAKKVAKHMFELFWYPKIPKKKLITVNSQQWLDVKDNYKKDTRPRDNNLETLYEVTANHIDLVLTCHPALTYPPEFVQQLVDEFIILVASKGTIKAEIANWGMSKIERDEFQKQVKHKLILSHGREELDESAAYSSGNTSASLTPELTPPESAKLHPTKSNGTGSIFQSLGAAISLPELFRRKPSAESSDSNDSDYVPSSPDSHASEEEQTGPRSMRSKNSPSVEEQLEKTIKQAQKLTLNKGP